MAIAADAVVRACPGCGEAMRRQSFARRPEGRVDLDLCFGCRAIWFDAYESSVLAAAGVIELFRIVNTPAPAPPRPLDAAPQCVTCRATLQLTHDVQRTNRFVYYRCPAGHGRFTTFLQFLREKSFVRSLTDAEAERLRVTVAQVRCSSCGAPVDIGRDAQCPYCRAPIAILDADAVRKVLAELDAQRPAPAAARTVDPGAVLEALLMDRGAGRDRADAFPLLDLVGAGLGRILAALGDTR